MASTPFDPTLRATIDDIWSRRLDVARGRAVTDERREAHAVPSGCSGIRTILVPPDIVPVQRRSPILVKKRTPWRPRPDGEVTTERTGGRAWFSDRLFVEPQDGHTRAGYGASIAVHVSCTIVLIVVMATRIVTPRIVMAGPSLVMPAMVSMPIGDVPLPGPRSIQRTSPNATPPPPAPARALAELTTAAPVEAPAGVSPETGIERFATEVEGGVPGGVAGGIAGGSLDAAPVAGPSSAGPLRVGGTIKAPQKIKDVRPVYPDGALSSQARGAVIIEATIGIDGKVKETKVLRSIPPLDQAALDAVRQWEYTPSLLNGAPVAVIMTIIVNFAIQ